MYVSAKLKTMKLIPSDDVSIRKVYLELTQRCNLNCTSCFRQNWDFPQTQMSEEIFEHCLNDLKQIDSLEEIVLGGIGEPTMHPKFKEWVKCLPDVKLTVTSNAYMWDDELIDLLASRFSKVVVSVDGLPDTFHIIRTFEFSKMEANIRKLIERRNQLKKYEPFLIAQTVISEYNVDEVNDVIIRCAKIGFMKIILSNLLPQNAEDKEKILYTLHDNPRMKAYRNKWLNAAMSNQIQIKFPNTQLKTERKCNFVFDGTLTINSDGNIAPCYRFAHPSIEYVFGRRKQVYAFTYGNVLKQTVQEIWDSKKYLDLRTQNLRNRFPSCPDCDLVDCCDYVNDSQCDCRGQYPSCADCMWTRDFVQCI